MTSKDIYSILSSKPHNPHYLNRYWKFIQALQYQIEIKGITEEHHICPKSHDLFPEYKSLKRNPWNGVHLTKRQHFISHWILAKAYKEKQIYAFWAMCNAQSPKDDRIRAYNISSKVYEQSKNIFLKKASKDRKGKATYIDNMGNKITCSTKDPRVLSGELISMSSGRKYKPRSKESKNRTSIALKKAKHNPNKTVSLYKLDIKLEVLLYTEKYEEMLKDGWSSKCTPEYRTKISILANKNMSVESRKKAAQSISKSKMGVSTGPINTERRKSLRKYDGREYNKLYYNPITDTFKMLDPFDVTEDYILVFTKNNGSRKYDISGNYKLVNKKCPTPPGYYDIPPTNTILVLNTSMLTLSEIKEFDYDKNIHIKISVPNGDRIKLFRTDINKNIYYNKKLITKYGLPNNCIYH